MAGFDDDDELDVDESAAAMAKKASTQDYTKLEGELETIKKRAAAGGSLAEAVEAALLLEKQQRLSADLGGTKRCATAILHMCFEKRDWDALLDNVVLLSKRRAQLKQVCGLRRTGCDTRARYHTYMRARKTLARTHTFKPTLLTASSHKMARSPNVFYTQDALAIPVLCQTSSQASSPTYNQNSHTK